MRKLSIPYTIRRNGVYQLNLRWHRQFIRYSLHTRDPYVALGRVSSALAIISEIDSQLPMEAVKGRLLIAHKDPSASDKITSIERPNSLLLSQAFVTYSVEKKLESWSVRTAKQNEATYRVLREIIGDMPLYCISKDVAREYKKSLLIYPANRNKGVRKQRSLEKLMAESWPVVSLETARNSLSRVTTFFNWLLVKSLIRVVTETGVGELN